MLRTLFYRQSLNKVNCFTRQSPAICSSVTVVATHRRWFCPGVIDMPGKPQTATLEERFPLDSRQSSYTKKSIGELIRHSSVLALSSKEIIAKNSEKLLKIGPKILGRRLFESLMRTTFYAQYACGETPESIYQISNRLREKNIKLILLMVEENGLDVAQDLCVLEKNTQKFIDVIKLVSQTKQYPANQLRLSAVVQPGVLVYLSKLLERLETAEKTCLYKLIYHSIAGEDVDNEVKSFLKKVQNNFDEIIISEDDLNDFCVSLKFLGRITETAKQFNVRVLVDGEMDRMNPAILMLTVGMMQCCNKEATWIYGTYQTYLRECENRMNFDFQYCQNNATNFGVKLVRGAYMETERQLAASNNLLIPPVWDTFDQTNHNFNKLFLQLLDYFKASNCGSVMAATNNWESISMALHNYESLFRYYQDRAIFAQLYGMADYLSESLASNGFFVYQCVTFGPVSATLPFLARRAQENFTMMARANADRKAINQEVKRRLLGKLSI